jgi:myo-inositol-1(or 4)-monophosphatase
MCSPAQRRHRSRNRGDNRHAALTTNSPGDELIDVFARAAQEAGELALGYFRPGGRTSAEVLHKDGGSPVTEADILVDRFLECRLTPLFPEAGWLSEEAIDSAERLAKELVLVVDPIDGTRGFASGHAVWAIAVALVRFGRPIVGVVHAPALQETYVASEGGGARLNGETIRVSSRGELALGSKVSAPARLAEDLRRAGLAFDLQPRLPSLALRIAHVARGDLDANFASQNAHDWDLAAADLILQEAGGRLATFDGCAITYNRVDTRHGALVAAPDAIHRQVHAAARRVPGVLTP